MSEEKIERRVVLSHAPKDKDDIQKLRDALLDRGVSAWHDVHEQPLGGELGSIRQAIHEADGLVLLLTPASISSDGVQRQAQWALETKLERPGFAILPLLRGGLERPALKLLFGAAELVAIVLGEGDAVESAVPAIVQALGLAAQDASPRADPLPAPPMAELSIELEAPFIHEKEGTRRAAAKAKVRYFPAGGGRGVDGRSVDFVAPIGPIEAGELRWYLEDYWVWPFGVFKERAAKVEANLKVWGRKLFDALLAREEGRAAFEGWRDAGKVDRRITVLVDDRGGEEGRAGRMEAAALALALPWELLADGEGYLFEGSLRARVRRMLPSERALPAAEPRLPLRVLLVLARPEEKGVGFIDPRVSAIPLAEALEALGESVDLTVLGEGTLKALREELDAGEQAGKPYQVVHFDGHGVYDERRGLGQLCFEDAEDAAKGLLVRRAELVDADVIGSMLRERRVPLFVLEACQTAMAETLTASVAAALLRSGVASVVAMSHAVLVETARRFVKAFYEALVGGDRIGAAMVRAQHALKDDPARGEIQESTLVLQDWMVPVLFQEDADARLFPGGADLRPAAVEDRKLRAKVRRGDLKDPPKHGFVGRARALLAIDRLLVERRYLAIVGDGGQGKTALAEEAARWLLAMRRVERVAFVSVEEISEARAVLDVIGRQLVPGYSVGVAEGTGSEEEKLRRALLPVEGVLQRRRVLIVVDNLESVLPALGKVVEEGTEELLGMIRGMSEVGRTRVILTSREAPPGPLDGSVFLLPALGRREGMELLAGVLRAKGMEPLRGGDKGDKEAAENLVEAVGGHARSLVMLGELVAEKGVKAVVADVRAMMGELEERYPEQRERSLIASVRLSLKRLPEGMREKIRGLAVFQGAARIEVIAQVLRVEHEEALELCRMLVGIGLADANGPYLLLDPGLGAALSGELTAEEREAVEGRWLHVTMELVGFLYQQRNQNKQISNDETRIALTDLLAILAKLEREVTASRADAVEAIGYVTRLEALVSALGLPRVLARLGSARRAFAVYLPAWGRGVLMAESEEVNRKLEAGDVAGALEAARGLRNRAEAADDAYPMAAYDRAIAWHKLGRMLERGGRPEEALSVLAEARGRFSTLAASGDRDAAGMAAGATIEMGNALLALGRLDEAAAAYEDGIQQAKIIGNRRNVAVGQLQLGTARLSQGQFEEALRTYQEARTTFEALGEPAIVAIVWHQIGIVHAESGNADAAEQAYKISLALVTVQGNRAGEAGTLHQLGTLYLDQGRLEEATTLFRQAVDLKRVMGNPLDESTSLNNLGIVYHKLHRLDEAREALSAGLALIKPYGHTAEPWKFWAMLEEVEREAARSVEANNARQEALRTYRAYRLDGGDPNDWPTRFITAFAQTLQTAGLEAACALLPDATQVPDWFAPIFRALQSIAAGNRDPALAADPTLHPTLAVELALLLESLPPSDTPIDQPCPCGSGLAFPQCHGAPDPT